MQKNPHQLIEGIVIAAYAVGANQVVHLHPRRVRAAGRRARRRDRRGLRGRLPRRATSSARASTARWSCTAARAPTSAARRPALLDSLEGKRGNPRLKPPFPANQGLYQGPTLINNVETLSTRPAHHRAGRRGVRGDRRRRTRPGTKLVSVTGNVQRPGQLRDRARHVRAREIIYGLAGGPPEGREVKLWFPGGSSSPVLTADDLDLPYDFDSMAKAGSMLGSGAIIVVDDSQSVVDVALKLAKFYRHESCGKCTPCREGTNWTVKMLERIDGRRGDADGPRHHGLGPGADHRQLPVRARRRDGDAGRLDDREVPRRVRGAHRGRARARRPRAILEPARRGRARRAPHAEAVA